MVCTPWGLQLCGLFRGNDGDLLHARRRRPDDEAGATPGESPRSHCFSFIKFFLYNCNRIVIVIYATVPRKRGGGEVDIVSIHLDRYSAVFWLPRFLSLK